MREFFGHYFGIILILLGVALVLTAIVFRKRLFERGTVPRKGKAADVDKIKRENPPDEWSRNH